MWIFSKQTKLLSFPMYLTIKCSFKEYCKGLIFTKNNLKYCLGLAFISIYLEVHLHVMLLDWLHSDFISSLITSPSTYFYQTPYTKPVLFTNFTLKPSETLGNSKITQRFAIWDEKFIVYHEPSHLYSCWYPLKVVILNFENLSKNNIYIFLSKKELT